MQPTFAILTALTVASSTLAVKIDRPLAFTTFPCIECKATGPDRCELQGPQKPYHPAKSEECYQLNARHQSLRVDDAQPDKKCELHLYRTTNCTGTGPTFPFEGKPGNCKLIPAGENVSYQVLCY